MKYESKKVTKGIANLRLEQVTKAQDFLIDALTQLGAGMHDDKLKKMINAAYMRTKHIRGILVEETK